MGVGKAAFSLICSWNLGELFWKSNWPSFSYAWRCLRLGDFVFTDSTMGFYQGIHHHLGEYGLKELVANSASKIRKF